MSTVTVRKTFYVNGVATAVTSFTLGVTRSDGGAIVVATGTAMTAVSGETGTYEYTFTAPAASLTYHLSFVITAADGNVYNLTDSFEDEGNEDVPLPALTGDNLVDTFNSLIVERLRVSRAGSRPNYSLHGHRVDFASYLKYLDDRIMALRREIAAANPWEEIGVGY